MATDYVLVPGHGAPSGSAGPDRIVGAPGPVC